MRIKQQPLLEALLSELKELLEPHSLCIARRLKAWLNGDKLKVTLFVFRRWLGRHKVLWYSLVRWLHKLRKL